jgi:hypothetical protein
MGLWRQLSLRRAWRRSVTRQEVHGDQDIKTIEAQTPIRPVE